MGVDPKYFVRQRKLAQNCLTSEDCTFDKCNNCGVCKNLKVTNHIREKRK